MGRATLTVLFEEPFWIAVYEREFDGAYEVCKIMYGAQPKDNEVYEYMLKNFRSLRFSPKLNVQTLSRKVMNPKRMQRAIKKQLEEKGVGTKAQIALKLQREQSKAENQLQSRKKREEESKWRFAQKQQKRKEKHRGH